MLFEMDFKAVEVGAKQSDEVLASVRARLDHRCKISNERHTSIGSTLQMQFRSLEKNIVEVLPIKGKQVFCMLE